ncbi:cAMP-regulated phosphoprotein 21-like isoform X2 [Mya arenaria]|uniref:cAMP-regulated phosphoprotein 21-like isoform X2 n=1 Tax=Mya arenaria TaxID=6604 RepID=UPI0022E80FE1|nr:cAMP-regulated phosphoprotein 21-like isoform X2 [Mya arenaria]
MYPRIRMSWKLTRVKMPSEPKEGGGAVAPMTRPSRSALLQKQPEIEEVEEEDTSPSSDQSDTTITAGSEVPVLVEGGSPENGSPEDQNPPQPSQPTQNKNNHISPKLKQLTRSEALIECPSPPLGPETVNLKSTASTCSSDSCSSGIGTRSSITSGSISGCSFPGRLEKSGSQSSEAGTSSSLSRDSSVDTPYKDSTGIDLEDFIKKTLNKTPKDRNMLIKLEVDLIKFIREPKHHYLKFNQMSSYDRMLVHRIAAFFGLDHNVDQTGKCVIVNKTASTRIPDFSFQEHIAKGDDSKPMMLLKRGGNSFDDSMSRNLQKPNMMNKARSLEERQQNYVEVRNRIFEDEEEAAAEGQPIGYAQEDPKIMGIVKKMERPQSLSSSRDDQPWSSCDSSGYGTDSSGRPTRIFVPKANSFGGTGTFMLQNLKSPMRGSSLSKADSLSMQYGMPGGLMRPMLLSSPSCHQSDASSISGASSSGPVGPVLQQQGSIPAPGQQVYWVASDPGSIPAGSVLINPQTGQPFRNPDGTMHKFTPGQPLPSQSPSQIYQSPHDWTSQELETSEMCQQLSVVQLTPQSSVESGGGGDPGVKPPQQTPSQPNPGAQVFTPQAHQQQQQGVFYQTSQGVPGQAGIRYMCPVNYCPGPGHVPQGQIGYSPTPGGVQPDSGAQPAHAQQFCPQYGNQNISGNTVYSVTSQGVMAQSCDYQCLYNVTSPTDTNNSAYSSYPVSYNSQQQTVVAPNQSQMYYTYQNPQQSNTGQPAQGYMYTGQNGITYQSSSPPSQNSTVTQNVNMTLQQAQVQQPQGVVQGVGLGSNVTVTPSPGAHYMTFPSPQGAMTSHNPHFHQQQTFTSPIRPVAPQFVPMAHTVPMPGHAAQGMPLAQPFHHPLSYRPNMQVPMQMQPSQPPQQPLVVPGVSRSPNGQAGHVTVSARGLGEAGACETDTGDTQATFRPQQHSQGEIRLQYHPVIRTPNPPILPQTRSPSTSQPHSLRSSQPGDGPVPLTTQDSGCGRGVVGTSHMLEVCDFSPRLTFTDAPGVMAPLLERGGALKLLPIAPREGLSGLTDPPPTGGLIAPNHRLCVVFPDPGTAAQALKTHSKKSYKLKLLDFSISDTCV